MFSYGSKGRILKKYFTVICILFFLHPVIAFARDIEITVEDEDLAWPLEGAVIILRGGVQFICDEDGIARVTLPDDRQTVISITYPGYEPLRMTIPAADVPGVQKFTAALRLGGVMTSQELVLEAARPETSETKSGRSVAISERELTRTAEIGILEDVMNSVKLLPGVGYSGMFGAMPSIRGGDPGDLTAVLDGFYLERPYYWMGSVSIFDPKMVSSARLSHGVFSSRYGQTTSGLLEVTSKSPSVTETELEAAVGTSAASVNLSLPLSGKGGILFMGKVTYWDTLVWAAKGLAQISDNETLQEINAISTAPYIRSAAVSANYRFTPDLEWRLNAFFGADGVGAEAAVDYSQMTADETEGVMEVSADYLNMQGFLITGLTASPAPKLALRFTGGAGFMYTLTEDYINNDITAPYNEDFLELLPPFMAQMYRGGTYTAPNINAEVKLDTTIINIQGRADADIDLGRGFIAAFGVQELYSVWKQFTDVSLSFIEIPVSSLSPETVGNLPPGLLYILPYLQGVEGLSIIMPRSFSGDVKNHGFTTSAYTLLEYTSPNQRFGTELGLRLDHLYFMGKNFNMMTKPAFNPRLNIDINIFKNRGYFDSFSTTLGTGLFSSINSLLSFFDPDQFGIGGNSEIEDVELKFNRSWTSVIGFKLDFLSKYSFNIEGYYKRIFDRGYITADILSSSEITPTFHFDGVGNVWGFDLQLQKMESRFIDGWISYTFTWAKYLDPSAGGEGVSMGSVDTIENWYYPSFHRFHNCNIVLNIKPAQMFNIAVRFGFASGQETNKVDNRIYPYPVLYINNEDEAVLVQKYRRDTLEEKTRTAWSLPLDIKFSFFPVNRNRRTNMEIYFSGENLLSVVYKPKGNPSFNEYTGREEPDVSSGNFDLPIPMVSFGFKWKY
ncbi:MAG: TonB-dependent receptor plug domain-containing protein [Treponema sp.]|jgi:hypothetical protein|nr:TonB-dependent receptor plug domain-containing protein [Treponema sp.]